MSSLFKNYPIGKLNKQLGTMISANKVNHLKLLVATDAAKLSITLLPAKELGNRYHGLHPSFDANRLIEFLSKDINSGEQFWDRIGKLQVEYRYMDLITTNSEEYIQIAGRSVKLKELEINLLGRAVLQMASNFGVRFKVAPCSRSEIQENLISIWRHCGVDIDQSIIDVENKDNITRTPYWQVEGKNSYISLLGIWPEEAIKRISECYEAFEGEKGELNIRKRTGKIQSDSVLSELLTFCPKYKSQYFKLPTSSVYYSGVMPKVMKIELQNDSTSSFGVKYLTLHVARTTFATVDFMDNPAIINHPFFHSSRVDNARYEQMVHFDLHEDKAQKKYLYFQTSDNCKSDSSVRSQRAYELMETGKINRYLQHSYATHTVAVSANIETRDRYLLLGKRGKMAIDAGEYYCSVNGQTEFLDENVSFYRKSVFEDLPSMNYESEFRVDLNREIQREAIAELGISLFNNNWKYYGISYLSINNYPNETDRSIDYESARIIKTRRMHFNVLIENETLFDFEDVLKSQKHATEKFENSIIKGIRVMIYKGNIDRMKRKALDIFNWVYRNKSELFIASLLVVSVFNKSVSKGLEAYSYQGIRSAVDIALLGIYLSVLSVNWLKGKETRKKKIHRGFALSKYTDRGKDEGLNMMRVFEALESRIKQEEEELHAIFRVMFMLYFLDKTK